MQNDNIYFASKEAQECANVLLRRSESFYSSLRYNAYLDKITRMWRAYHGAYNDSVGYGHQIEFTGEEGELVSLPVNHFRNLARITYNMVTATRPSMQARAVNTDSKSLAQTYLANGILEYYMREKNLEYFLKKAVEYAIVLGSGFIKMEWNSTSGEAYDIDPDTGEINYEGDIVFTNLSPLDVVVDGTKETWQNEWILVRSFVNKYNLLAKYPELSEKIINLHTKNQSSVFRLAIFSNDETDDVPIFEFYHKKTEAVPEGRYMLFATDDCVFLDTKMPYPDIPVYRIVPSEILGTPYGYTDMYDVFPLQEMINSCYSTIASNINAFGVQNVFFPRDGDLTVASVEGGLNIIEGIKPPQSINLTQTPAEVFKYLEILIQSAETISGINSVARGNPEASLKSGAALALVQSMSLQYVSGLQQSYVKLIEDMGSSLIKFLQIFAQTPRVAAIVGENNRSILKEFNSEDLDKISRVYVDMGNPLAQCLGKDTPILMYDGSIKMIQDIKIDDKVMGPDSKYRTVSNVNSGKEQMYEVISKNSKRNIAYKCNESHILTLRYCSDDYRYNVKKGDQLDISVREYLNLSERHKNNLQGFKVGVNFDNKDLIIPPYILGSWLGDGSSATTSITTADNEIRNEWFNYANSIGMQLRTSTNTNSGQAKTYFITSGESHGKSDRNPMMNEFHSMEVLNNKHIPKIYLNSSREQRLELLAGLIDTDGSRIGETLIFTQKSNILTEQVIFLAESLGFRVNQRKVISKGFGVESEINKVSIGGNTWEIPSRLPRKQCKKIEKSNNWLNYGIEVKSINEDTYYGFTLKEEPHFVLGNFVVTHNTTAGRVQMAEQMLQMGAIKNPNQYIQIINTGRLDSAIENEEHELILIKAENEKIMKGLNPLVAPTDHHKEHIMEHAAVIADPELREDPQLTKAVMDHIEAHMNMLRNTDPDLLSMVGEVALPPLQQPMPPPGNPGGGMPPGNQQGTAPGVLQPQQGLPQGGDVVHGPGTEHGQKLPNIPKPPAPFKNLPTNPNQLPGR